MSTKTKRRLSRFADGLEAVVTFSLQVLAGAVELVLIDAVYGKAKYRKRPSRARPIVHRTVIVRERAPRVYAVNRKQEQ